MVISLRFPVFASLFIICTILQSDSQDAVKETMNMSMNSAQTMNHSNPGKLDPVHAVAHSFTHPPTNRSRDFYVIKHYEDQRTMNVASTAIMF